MRSVVIGTAGHIDHGKSALVWALTGSDPDRLKEEKERGITIDLGFAHWEAGDISFAFVDVPGHERFVRNMLAGVGGIDCVLLVIAADGSVMPQTREHFQICRLLRIPFGLIALTKADLVDEDTLELVRLETRELVAGSFLESAPVLAVSSKTGQGLPALREALLEAGRSVPARRSGGPVRLPIDRVFSVKGFGTVVTGTLVSGEIAPDDELQLLPRGRSVKVRGLQVHGGRQPRAAAGQRVAANLGGVEVAEIARGDTLVTPASFEPTTRIDAVLELVPDARPLRHGSRVRFHQGTSEVLGRVAVARTVSEATAAARSVQGPGEAGTADSAEVPPAGRAYVRIRLESPAVVTRGDRYILRAYSPPVTIAGGLVLDPHPPRAGVRTTAGRARFEALDPAAAPPGEQDLRSVVLMIDESGPAGMPVHRLISRAGIPPGQVAETIEELVGKGIAARAGEVLVASRVVEGLKEQLLTLVGDHHRSDPLSEGIPREEVKERLFAYAAPAVFERVLTDLGSAGKLVVRDRLALTSHHVALSAEEARVHAQVEQVFREAGLRPPDQALLAGQLRLPGDLVEKMTRLLIRQKVLVKVDTLLFHEQALKHLKDEMAALRSASAPGQSRIDVAGFKERYGVTRKYAIPLLEYLDRERVTRRSGDMRTII
jgi:selenocysteine-specific elongation factor